MFAKKYKTEYKKSKERETLSLDGYIDTPEVLAQTPRELINQMTNL